MALQGLKRNVTIKERVDSGKWKAVDSSGKKEVDGYDAHYLVCSECGKRYKWNQGGWLDRHEREHEMSRKYNQRNHSRPVTRITESDNVDARLVDTMYHLSLLLSDMEALDLGREEMDRLVASQTILIQLLHKRRGHEQNKQTNR